MHKMNMHSCFLYVILCFLLYETTYSRTERDDQMHLLTKNGRIIIGTILGNRDYVKQGLDEGGTPNAYLHAYFGDVTLQLGIPYVDFPLCPAIHLAINYGQHEHLSVASLLYNSGADINFYMVPSIHNKNPFDRGHPPGIMYGLGLGQKPMYFHAGFIQRFHKTHPYAFNMTVINEWIVNTGNPPLIHMCVLLDNVYGVSLLIKEFKLSINSRDHMNITALHIAAWKNDINMMIFLIQHGANVFDRDNYNRTAMHYAVMRGNYHAMILLISSIQSSNKILKSKKIIQEYEKDLLFHMDITNKTIFDIVLESPIPSFIRDFLFNQSIIYNIPMQKYENLCMLIYHRNKELSYIRNEFLTSIHQSIDPNDVIIEEIDWNYPKNYHIFQDFPYLEKIFSYNPSINSSTCLYLNPMILSIESSIIIKHDNENHIFLQEYFSRQIPILFLNSLTLRSNIWGNILKNDFIHRYGEMIGQSYMKNYINKKNKNYLEKNEIDNNNNQKKSKKDFRKTETISFKEYISNYMIVNNHFKPCYHHACINMNSSIDTNNTNNNDNNDEEIYTNVWNAKLYDQSDELQDLFDNDLPIPNLFKVCYRNKETKSNSYYDESTEYLIRNEEESYHIHAGTRYSGTSISAKNASWELLLVGYKIWFLASPGMNINITNILYNTGVLSDINGHNTTSNTTISQLSAWKWSQLIAPSLINDGSIASIIQHPGDVLYIPHEWQSVSISLSDTISVSQEFCHRIETDQRIPPLGYTIYGGEDKYYGLGMYKTHIHSSYKINVALSSEDKRFPVFDSKGST